MAVLLSLRRDRCQFPQPFPMVLQHLPDVGKACSEEPRKAGLWNYSKEPEA